MDCLCCLYLVFVMLLDLFIAGWERADLLALVCDVLLRFCHFPM